MTWSAEVSWHYLPSGAPMADGRGISVRHFGGEVGILWKYDPFADNGMSHWSVPVESLTGVDASATFADVMERGSGLIVPALRVDGDSIRVAHWFVALVFLLAWSGWLVWRWRRMRRLTEVEVRG